MEFAYKMYQIGLLLLMQRKGFKVNQTLAILAGRITLNMHLPACWIQRMYIFIVSGDLIFNTQKGSKTKLVVCTHSSHYKIKWKCLNKYPRSITSYSIYKLESNRTTSCNVLAKKPCLNRKLYLTKTFSNLDERMRLIYRLTD